MMMFTVGFLLGMFMSMGILLAVIFHDELIKWYKRMMRRAYDHYLDVSDIIRNRFSRG